MHSMLPGMLLRDRATLACQGTINDEDEEQETQAERDEQNVNQSL